VLIFTKKVSEEQD